MGSQPAPALVSWLAAQAPVELFTVSVCQAEILAGIAVLPKGRRRDGLQIAAAAMFREDFVGRVLPFDADAAVMYAELFAARRRAGRPPAMADLIIASVARVRGARIVTRDAGGFAECGLTVIDPWATT